MSGSLETIAYNVVPIVALLIGIFYSLAVLYRLRDLRLGVFTVLLVLLLIAELSELRAFLSTGELVMGSRSAELFETVIHVFAAFSVFYVSRFIEDEREAKNELERRQVRLDKYRQVFQKSESPAIITDKDARIIEVNDAFVRESGYSRDEVMGNLPQYLLSDKELFDEALDRLEENKPWTGEIKGKRKDGKMKYYRGSLVPILINGEKEGYAGFFVDLTKRKRYEDTLSVINRVLRHDLRNDINVVKGYIDLVKNKTDNTELSGYLSKASEKIDELTNKGNTARELERFLKRDLDTMGEPVDLVGMLKKEIKDAERRFSNAVFEYEGPKGEVKVIGTSRLKEIFGIVLENAVVHNDKQAPVVNVGVEENESNIVVSIADNGKGVPDANKDSIFGRREIDQLNHGRGMDLFFADRVVESYGGEIWVEDNDPEGSVFKIRLPRPSNEISRAYPEAAS